MDNKISVYDREQGENEIAAAYEHAMRDVDRSEKRSENIGKEYMAKADEMLSLGDYEDAQNLASEYAEKAELYLDAENRQRKILLRLGVAEIIVSAATVALSVAVMLVAGLARAYSGAEYISSVIMAAAGDVFCVTGAVLGYALIDKVRYNARKRKTANSIEKFLLAASCALMFVPTIIAYMDIELYGTLYLAVCVVSLAALVLAMLRQQFADTAPKIR